MAPSTPLLVNWEIRGPAASAALTPVCDWCLVSCVSLARQKAWMSEVSLCEVHGVCLYVKKVAALAPAVGPLV